MKKPTAIIFIISAILSACNNNQVKNTVPETGSMDSMAIAQDTAMQVGLESSYEYHKTLTASEKLVYDVIAYGGPASKGRYAIIRRGADNKPDTIAEGKREGIVANTFIADLNKNTNEEIYIILQSADSNKYENLIAYELDKRGKTNVLLFHDKAADMIQEPGYRGKDSIYVESNFLVQRFPIYKEHEPICCPTSGWKYIYYALNKNEFRPIKQGK